MAKPGAKLRIGRVPSDSFTRVAATKQGKKYQFLTNKASLMQNQGTIRGIKWLHFSNIIIEEIEGNIKFRQWQPSLLSTWYLGSVQAAICISPSK